MTLSHLERSKWRGPCDQFKLRLTKSFYPQNVIILHQIVIAFTSLLKCLSTNSNAKGQCKRGLCILQKVNIYLKARIKQYSYHNEDMHN